MFAKNIPKRLLIYWLSIVTVHAVTSRSESNFGLPGEEFSGFRYPLEAYYRVQINPAFLPSVDRRGIYGGFNPEFESSYQTSAAIFLPARTTLGFTDNRNGSGSMALFVQNLNSGDIEARSPTKLELGTFSDSKMLISLMYGQKFTPYLSVGLGFKFINHSTSQIREGALESLSKSGFGTDLGVWLEPTENFGVGLSVANAPFRPDMTLLNEEEKWPMTARLDLALGVQDQRLMLTSGIEYIKNDQRGDGDAVIRPRGGTEFRVHDRLVLGAGYANDAPTGGVRFELPGLSIQYSVENCDLGLLHHASVGLSFGSTGEERYLALTREMPDKLFAKALKAYREGRYFDAADLFALFCDRYSDEARVDQALDYTAKSLEGVGSSAGAEFFYRKLAQERPASRLTANALASVVRLKYEAGDDKGLEEIFNELSRLYRDSRAAADSRYYLGMALNRGDIPDEAIEYLSLVPSTSENYLFAQYGLGLCYLKKTLEAGDSSFRQAIISFTNVLVQRDNITVEERALRDRATLVIGHLLRENGNLDDALYRYAQVGEGAFYWEACVASAYCYYDMKKYDSAMSVAEQVVSARSDESHYAEALLVTQQCLQALGSDAEARQVRDRLHEILASVTPISPEAHEQELLTLRQDEDACASGAESKALAYARLIETDGSEETSVQVLSQRTELTDALKRVELATTRLSEYLERTERQRRLSDIRDALILVSP